MTAEVVDLDAIELPQLVNRKRPAEGPYAPHHFDRVEDVPALSDIGGEHVTRFTTSSHNKEGFLTADPEVIQEMIDHYAQKINAAADEIALYEHDPQEGAETLIVSYGVTSRAANVAVEQVRSRGRKVSSIVLQTLYPVPERALRKAMEGMRHVIVPEMNMGQYRQEVERLAPVGARVTGVNRMDTILISPREIELEGEFA